LTAAIGKPAQPVQGLGMTRVKPQRGAVQCFRGGEITGHMTLLR
jgi:hypothetical protein